MRHYAKSDKGCLHKPLILTGQKTRDKNTDSHGSLKERTQKTRTAMPWQKSMDVVGRGDNSGCSGCVSAGLLPLLGEILIGYCER
jgi:hypothetical protein